MDEQADRYRRMMRNANQTAEFIVGRVSIQEGRTFSQEAMDQLNHELVTWVATRLMRRWEATQEPPTHLRVTVTVEVG